VQADGKVMPAKQCPRMPAAQSVSSAVGGKAMQFEGQPRVGRLHRNCEIAHPAVAFLMIRGSSPHSLSQADIRRALAASFPTPFSTALGVFGLIAGPFSALRPLNFE